MAAKLRALAISQYGCIDFTSVTEGDKEIAISYWQSTQQIKAWKQDPQHLLAQHLGHSKWYKSYQVEIVKIEREYGKSVPSSVNQTTSTRCETMTNLKIRVYKNGATDPATTVTIPGGVLKIASKLIPTKAAASLHEKGIDLEEIIKLAENPDAHGTLIEVEEHQDNEKIVIALE